MEQMYQRLLTMEAAVQNLQHQVGHLTTDNAAIRQQVVYLTTDNAAIRQQVEHLTTENAKVKHEVAHLTNENAKCFDEVVSLRHDKAVVQEDVVALSNKVEVLESTPPPESQLAFDRPIVTTKNGSTVYPDGSVLTKDGERIPASVASVFPDGYYVTKGGKKVPANPPISPSPSSPSSVATSPFCFNKR